MNIVDRTRVIISLRIDKHFKFFHKKNLRFLVVVLVSSSLYLLRTRMTCMHTNVKTIVVEAIIFGH